MFFCGFHLCESFTGWGVEEDRVVAKSAPATHLPGNYAFTPAFSFNLYLTVGGSHCDVTLEVCLSLAIRGFPHETQKFSADLIVGAVWPGEARAVNTGFSVESVDAEAGIVRHGMQSAVLCYLARFLCGVFCKRFAIFYDFGGIGEGGKRYHLDREVGEEMLHLARFVGIVTGYEKFHTRDAPLNYG
jgi:hypothetical protein